MITIFSIHKKENEYQSHIKQFTKMIQKYSKIEDKVILTKEIIKAQKVGSKEAKMSYSKAFEKILYNAKNTYSVALDENGKCLDSFSFSKILQDKDINFFIAGSYGFEKDFLQKCNICISLSNLTFSHKLAKLVLYEQVFRGFCIANHHPYHK